MRSFEKVKGIMDNFSSYVKGKVRPSEGLPGLVMSKQVWGVFLLAVLLGIFFQMNRANTFLSLGAWQSEEISDTVVEAPDGVTTVRDEYLIIYDPLEVQSVLTRHMAEKILQDQKKSTILVPLQQAVEIADNCPGIIIVTSRLNAITGLPAIENYVEQGGTVAVLRSLERDMMPAGMMTNLGVTSIGDYISAYGIRVVGDMFLGIQGYGFESAEYATAITDVGLTSDAILELTSWDGHPIIWTHRAGKGKYIVCNSQERDDKNNFGAYTAIFSRMQEDYVYPIMNMKVYYIDDFPSPVPAGEFHRIYEETGLNTADFYRKLWWPEMLSNAEKYNIKYTGLIIESYGDQVKGPFQPLSDGAARNNLIVYGRELLKNGGELGIHGYNHQSLALAGARQEELGYNPWGSQEDMEESLRELKRYIEEVYPGYDIHTYVPPSNILSPEGKAAVQNVFPTVKIFASLYNGLADAKEYFQHFRINPDGTYDIPRVSSGYVPKDTDIWEEYNTINYLGVFSHFVHPDEIFYEESAGLTWSVMKEGQERLVSDIYQRFPWLEPVTATEAAEKMQDYFDLDYTIERKEDGMVLRAWGFRQPVYFILRTQKEIKSVEGGKFKRIQADAYILRVEQSEFVIQWDMDLDKT